MGKGYVGVFKGIDPETHDVQYYVIASAAPDMLRAPGLNGEGERWTWGGYSSSVAISVLGFSLWPHYFMKIYTARDVRTLKKTVIAYPTFAIFLVPILFIGFAGVMAFPGVEPMDAILPTIVTSAEVGLPPFIVGLFCAEIGRAHV